MVNGIGAVDVKKVTQKSPTRAPKKA